MRLFSILFFLLIFNQALYASEKVTDINVIVEDDALAKNVSLYLTDFKNQSLSRSLLNQIEKLSKEALKPYGYYSPEITILKRDDNDNVSLDVRINKNSATYINALDLQIIGPASSDPVVHKKLKALLLKKGQALKHSHYEKDKSLITSVLFELGYFDANWQKSVIEVVKEKAQASIFLHIESGVRYAYGPTQIPGNINASELIHRLNPLTVGKTFSANDIIDFNAMLTNMPYFKSVRVYPDIQKRENQQVPIIVQAVHKPNNSFEVGGGASTDDKGARVRFKWSKPWISKNGHYLEADIEASKVDPQARFSYTIPVDDPNNDVWRFGAGYIYDDLKTSHRLTTQMQRQWLTRKNWFRTAFLKYEVEDYDIADVSYRSKMLLPGISFARKKTRGGTTPYWGEQILLSGEFASASLASDVDLFKVQFLGQRLRTFDTRHLLLARLSAGAIVTEEIDRVPISMRFFAGGDKSIRGYAYESIAPKVAEQTVGGKYLATGTIEYNYQFAKNWRAALFIDAGTATNDFSEDLQVGTGLGVRWLTPIGPVRIDYAFAVTDENRTGRFSITIGPEI